MEGDPNLPQSRRGGWALRENPPLFHQSAVRFGYFTETRRIARPLKLLVTVISCGFTVTYVGTGGRTAKQGYKGDADGNRKRWAQLEKGDETGLDYAQARYYSNKQGRFTSPDEFGRQFGFAAVAYLCADREFIGKKWVRYLRRKGIPCRIRVRANTKVKNGRGLPVQARQLFRHCRVGHGEVLRGVRLLWGENWHIAECGCRRASI